jgi:hypothetical protein
MGIVAIFLICIAVVALIVAAISFPAFINSFEDEIKNNKKN